MNESLPPEPISVRRLRTFLTRLLPPPRAGRGLRTANRFRLPSHNVRRERLTDSLEPGPAADVSAGRGPPAVITPSQSPTDRPERNVTDRFFRSLLGDALAPKAAAAADKPAAPREDTTAALRQRLDRESPPRLPPAGLHHFLAARLGLHVPVVRIHVGPAADRFAAAHGADAVSFAERIVFRHRCYEPQTVAGVALLGHELTHVAAAVKGEATSTAAAAREERTALANEQRLRVELAPTALRSSPALSVPAAPSHAAQAPVATTPAAPAAPAQAVTPAVRAAAVERSLPAAPPSDRLPPGHVKQLKDEIYRELLDRIRTDFERGS
jgi:hypothetical protein